MSVERRKCLKTGENLTPLIEQGLVQNMKVFDNYTEDSCLLECRAEALYNGCGCLPYYYPAFGRAWNKSTTCNLEQLRCLSKQAGSATI